MNRLRELRKNKRLTLIELASKTGLAKSTLARLETEDVSIKSDIAKILADFYGVSVGYIMGVEAPQSEEDSIKLAFFNQQGLVTEKQRKMVEDFIEMIKKADSQ